jgi:hypothetical protein
MGVSRRRHELATTSRFAGSPKFRRVQCRPCDGSCRPSSAAGRGPGRAPGRGLTLNLSSRHLWVMTKVRQIAVTKAAVLRQRCQQCRKRFTAKTGGRPAMFCSASCRQRAYEERKRARSDTWPLTKRSSWAPRTAGVIAGSWEGQCFEPADAEAAFQKTGEKAREGTDFDHVAERLNIMAGACVSVSRQRTAQTERELHRSFRQIEKLTGRLRECFGLTRSFDTLVNNDIVNKLIVCVPPDDRRARLLRTHVAREIGAPGTPLGERRVFHIGLWCLQLMEHCAGLPARAPAATCEPPREDIILVSELHKLYVDVTGDSRWQTTQISGDRIVPGGPFVRLVMAVAAHISACLLVVKPPPPASLAKNLQALSKLPRRVGNRIRAVRQLA